ncbi:MAG: kynureninase [Burkholderiaceae bacterium]|jgi:kynureninase|nr:kynureninase [Burkholderiaceae bacterium]
MTLTRSDCAAMDAADTLAAHRAAFALPDDVIYLDGNSLGALPRATPARLAEVIDGEWGTGLIRAWNTAGWIDAPRRVGAKIAPLIGAGGDEVICTDSTSINLFKLLACALRLQRPGTGTGTTGTGTASARRVILSERGNFPTDLYIAQGLIDLLGAEHELVQVEPHQIASTIDALGPRLAVLMLTHVNFQTGAMHDLAALTAQAQRHDALVLWDLAHSAGAVPVNLNAAQADFAVGCGYKYLNGGPGAPAFVFVAGRHLARLAADPFAQPLSGWLGHRAPFAFDPGYAPATGIERFTVGTPSILALAALDCGVDTVRAAGIDALRAKSVALTALFITLVEQRCSALDLVLVTPRDAARRGSQVGYAHPQAWPVMQALIAARPAVIGDFRVPDILRFGFAPLYVRFVDIWDAVESLRDILTRGTHRDPRYQQRQAVT